MNLTPISNLVLSSLLVAYPETQINDDIDQILDDLDLKIPDEVKGLLVQLKDQKNLEDVQSEYIDTFDRGRNALPLYETEYDRNRAMAKGHDLSDIAAFYHAFGFNPAMNEGQTDMIDHISVELEFYALMRMKLEELTLQGNQEGMEIVEDGIKKFLKDHLGRWTPAILERESLHESFFYKTVFNWANQIIQNDCQYYDLQINYAKWYATEEVKDAEVLCASSSGGSCQS